MQQCTQNHSLCGSQLSRDTPLPNRVVDVGDSNNLQIKVYETQNELAKYTCLSHCWGKARIITTTLSALPLYKKRIPWDKLSTTFQDAIIFTRKLGIQYIWIDSLCIIQDSDDDWRTESSNMAAIYEDSYMTLAATKSANGAGGCFSTASPDCKAQELIFHNDAGFPHSRYVRRHVHQYANSDVVNSKQPLLRRGWVFQERLLSPRVLHFGDQELLWECLEDATCECTYIDWYKSQDKASEYLPRLMIGKISHTSKLLSQSGHLLQRRWHEIVEEYTLLDLTFEKDKLPALSGIAWQMQRARGVRYLAGLWEDTLLEDLLWNGSVVPSERAAKWRAPTWSWASVKGRITYGTWEPKIPYAKIIDVQCTSVGSDSMLELASTHLILSSYMVPLTLHREPSWQHLPYSDHVDVITDSEGETYGFTSDYTLPESIIGETMYCLWIAKAKKKPWNSYGLVLRCLDSALQMYERIGIGWQVQAYERIGIGWKNSVLISAEESEGESSGEALLSVTGMERVTVRIN